MKRSTFELGLKGKGESATSVTQRDHSPDEFPQT